MSRLPDAAALAKVRSVVVPVAGLFRLSRFPATEPYFAVKGAYRFDDPAGLPDPTGNPGAATFGVLYVAQDAETAFCESVIHGNSRFVAGSYEVSDAELGERHLVTFTHRSRKRLTVADLTGDALKALGLNNDISAGSDYSIPQQWAAALHAAHPILDGIRYVSRQHNSAHCFALFDRSDVIRDSSFALPEDVIDGLCESFNVKRV
ncbi:RES family NAD+ phosphorylase [Paucibacter sp. B2R-40]|uniref:RES family NAD+ phosphorylase n=1 Tax=Paucibacter sp. B2R-40 TaxID=2893554 RepID=UPI0021E375C9|nr:RES family NAD+ phosphorylase [Paucibacter sp. B2R-40]MCV2355384.1 RES family NAD+ phosphorylase [Paucibacter sp. B2R-40]